MLLNEGIGVQRNTASFDLSVSTLVDHLLNGLQVGVTPGDEGLSNTQHGKGGLQEDFNVNIRNFTNAIQI